MLYELKKKSISGIKWTIVSAVVVALLQIVQLVVLARFLSPNEYGVWGILNILIGFSYAFVDMGLSNSIIHFQEVDLEELSSLYWLNVIAGILVCLVLCLLAPLIAGFYKADALVGLIPFVALTFVIIPFGQQYQSLLQKELKFRSISLIEVVSKLIGFILMIILLFLGFKLHAVVYSTVVTVTVSSLLFFSTGNRKYRPHFIIRLDRVKKFIKFGIFQMMNRTTNYFNLQIDSILIGRLLGLEVLGIYTLAKNVVLRPISIINPIITRVTFPMMSKIQGDTVLLSRIYLKMIVYLSSVNFPLYLFLAFFADPIVRILFGAKWVGAVLLLQILSGWAALRSIGNPVGSLILAKGRADIEFYWNLAIFFIVPAAIYIGSLWGSEGVCYFLLVTELILLVPSWYFLVYRLCQLRLNDYLLGIAKPLLLALGAVVSVFLITSWISFGFFQLVVIFIIFGMFYWSFSKKYNSEFIEVVWEMVPRRL